MKGVYNLKLTDLGLLTHGSVAKPLGNGARFHAVVFDRNDLIEINKLTSGLRSGLLKEVERMLVPVPKPLTERELLTLQRYADHPKYAEDIRELLHNIELCPKDKG